RLSSALLLSRCQLAYGDVLGASASQCSCMKPVPPCLKTWFLILVLQTWYPFATGVQTVYDPSVSKSQSFLANSFCFAGSVVTLISSSILLISGSFIQAVFWTASGWNLFCANQFRLG